jgi:hypothetical protein
LGALGFARGTPLYAAIAANAAVLFMLPQAAGMHGRRVDTGAIAYLQANLGLGRVLSLGPLVPNYGAFFGVAEIGHNYLPVPANWVAYVRAHFMPESDGVNFHFGATPGNLDLAAYEAAGVSLVTVAPGAAFLAAGAATLAYRGAVMDIWRLPNAAPYFEAAGCRLAPVSRDELAAQCDAPSVLKRLELAWPGWVASVNGNPVAVTKTGDIFQSMALPAGDSRVLFTYTPPGIAFAWAACVSGLLLACCMQVRQWRRPVGPS